MGYLLDTNIVSRLARKRPPGALVERIRQNQSNTFISTITIEELLFGVSKAAPADQPALSLFVEGLLLGFPVLPYDVAAARWAARYRFDLYQIRRTIEHPDICIAAIAASRGLTLVTHNPKDFIGFSGIQMEDWVGDP